MKKIFVALICVLALSGCAYYVQLYETTSNFTKEGNAVFENDTVKITYYFWQSQGVLAFTIYNKLDVPIYIDWKKSSYVKNGDKFDYWKDEQTGEFTTQYSSVVFNKDLTGWDVGRLQVGESVTNSKTVKPERVTFITPHSKIYKSYFKLFNPSGILLKTTRDAQYIDSKVHKGKKTLVYTADYAKEKNPLTFRNFITLSTSEKFEKESYIDNEFYVSKVTEMKADEFILGYDRTDRYSEVPIYAFQSPNAFFVEIDAINSIAYRKKMGVKTYDLLYK
jgi:uncharacterized protein YceK